MMCRNRRQLVTARCAALAAALSLCVCGCQMQPKRSASPSTILGNPSDAPRTEYVDAASVPTRDDIVAIHHFWPQVPWLRNSSNEVVGFRVPVYFVSGETEKGAFVPGRIFVWVYRIERLASGELERDPAHIWEFNESEAMGYRVRKLASTGYYYGFMLNWPPNLDLAGHEIEVEFGYERLDGRLVLGAARRFKVPVPPDFRPPPARRNP